MRIIIIHHGYIAHAVGRKKEADIKRRNPNKKARRGAWSRGGVP